MIAKAFVFVFVLGVAAANNLAGVDPNTLSCDPQGQVFLLLPHFTECNKFFTCAHGNEVEMTCAPGTIFNFEKQTCDHIWATECVLRKPHEEEKEEVEVEEEEVEGSGEGDIGGSGEEEIEGSGYEWPEEDVKSIATPVKTFGERRSVLRPQFTTMLDCSSSAKATQQLPYKGDCQRYWRCQDGVPQSAFCADGLYFNVNTQQCDFENNVRCDVNHEYELDGEFIMYK